ncbi:MAG: translation initiation factor eIF-1A [Candidatus Aenigmarchaeota archaeon]|nr:translation initiation factor eIF-1A [Candidatus Aenigmarchaeota archaeon]MCK5334282.1 translation initiation factor eIF-1A [Candidatus Aenigmarchaeota archaeon]
MVFNRFKKRPKGTGTSEEYVGRIPTPRGAQTMGVVESRLGFGKMRVVCSDKKLRICRVPGKYKRRIWLREGDIVLVEPWELEGDKKGDIIVKYRPAQVGMLRRQGLLDELGV